MCQWPVSDENGFPAGVCGAPANEVDHIVHNMVRDDDDPHNLRALCHYHHVQKTAAESAEGRVKASRRRNAAKFYEHPAFR
ncbi:HNH endonuclease signature motif containing protein [Bifidobacterium cuniculi]|nr:HNH endonuclease signature motif containing protein [Bifidobacterium cuniculi]